MLKRPARARVVIARSARCPDPTLRMVVRLCAYTGDSPFAGKAGVHRQPAQLSDAALQQRLADMSPQFSVALAAAPPAAFARVRAVTATMAELWSDGRKPVNIITFEPELQWM